MEYYTIDSIISTAKGLENKTIREVCENHTINKKNKGGIGLLIEKYVFGLDVNNKSEPDFQKYGLDLELKVTPLNTNKNVNVKFNSNLVAKERLSLTNINYNNLKTQNDFYKSDLFKKIKNMLLIHYVYNADDVLDGVINLSYLLDFNKHFTQTEIKIILNDYKIIYDKVLNNEAHLLSESDTHILAATTKGSGNQKATFYSNSKIPAKKRNFTFKPAFMSELYHRMKNSDMNVYIETFDEVQQFKSNIKKVINEFKDVDLTSTSYAKGLNINNKSFGQKIINSIFNDKIKNFKYILKKYGYTLFCKTLNKKNLLAQELGLNYDLTKENINTEFKDSILFEKIVMNEILLVTLKTNTKKQKSYYFGDSHFINVKESEENIINMMQVVWDDTRNKFNNSEFLKIEYITRPNGSIIEKNNFISVNDDMIFHLRPHASNATIKTKTNDGKKEFTKQQFWLNKKFINKFLINNNL